jgi:hypothetical protein
MISALKTLRSFMTQQRMRNEHEDFNCNGEYRHRTVAKHGTFPEEAFFDKVECFDFDDLIDDLIDEVHPKLVSDIYGTNGTEVTPVKPNFEILRPLFEWAPADTIKQTFAVTTQFARGRVSDTLKQHWHSLFPACNVKRRSEPVAIPIQCSVIHLLLTVA